MTVPRVAICLVASFLVSCSNEPTRPPAIGEAYVAPLTLNLRQELSPKSTVSAALKHGDKLEILEYRRRFVRVRTNQGAEGWTDLRQLLTSEQMDQLRHTSESVSQYPSQGTASVFEALNMHSEPNRSAPSFWQIPDNGKVDVIAHRLTPRVQAAPPVTAAPVTKAQPQRRKKKDSQSQTKIAPPPPPPTPKPPANWQALSVPKLEPAQPATKIEPKPVIPGPMDDWSLVRTKDGKAGWVLTRMLNMAIPDEVAQYAEGHRITSYFPLGQIQDGDGVKNNWLWTTIVKGLQPYEFDSFRVFVWSRKHHRYETAYIERNIVGHYPVEVNTSGSVPIFSVLLDGSDGRLYRKTYTFEGYRIRMVKREPYESNAQAVARQHTPSAPVQPPARGRSLYARIMDRVRRLFH